MENMKYASIIRDRGQLTIPEEIRDFLDWAKPCSVITIEVTGPSLLTISPQKEAKNISWEEIWDGINLSRSLVGKKCTLSEFIIADRESH